MLRDDVEIEAVEENPPKKEKGIIEAFMEDPSVIPATVAQQIFSVVPGVAGGLAGFILAGRLAKAKKVKTKGVVIAALANAALTLLTIFLIVEAGEEEGDWQEAE